MSTEVMNRVLAAARVFVRGAAKVLGTSYDEPELERLARAAAHVLPAFRETARIHVPREATAPQIADPKAPHWIVKCTSPYGPTEFKPRVLFMHPTEEQANTEAERLAKALPGRRFAVYGSGQSFKVEADGNAR